MFPDWRGDVQGAFSNRRAVQASPSLDRRSGRQEVLGNLEPPEVLALLLVQCARVDEVADLVVHADLGKVLVQGLLELVVNILELGAVVAADSVLLLRAGEGLHIADDVAVVLAGLCAAVECQATALGLVLDNHAEVGPLLFDSLLTLGFHVRVEGAGKLPLDAHHLVPDLALERHVDIAHGVNELEVRLAQEGLDLLGLFILLLLVLDLGRHHLHDFAGRRPGEAPQLRRQGPRRGGDGGHGPVEGGDKAVAASGAGERKHLLTEEVEG
mmetsp:Transcript_25411/g.64769  ORF Transcript_25411/g.64769 Transcript_25411/m.64769 type:complete len:270 (-) Transcript_25411:71-880(-)